VRGTISRIKKRDGKITDFIQDKITKYRDVRAGG